MRSVSVLLPANKVNVAPSSGQPAGWFVGWLKLNTTEWRLGEKRTALRYGESRDGGGGDDGGGCMGRGDGGGGLGAATVTVTATFFATVTVGVDSTMTPSSCESKAVVAVARASAFVCTEAPTLASSSR